MKPVLIATGNHIGGHKILSDLGRISADPHEVGADKGWLTRSWADRTDAMEALKKVARRKGANAIIHFCYEDEYTDAVGIAVKVKPC